MLLLNINYKMALLVKVKYASFKALVGEPVNVLCRTSKQENKEALISYVRIFAEITNQFIYQCFFFCRREAQ